MQMKKYPVIYADPPWQYRVYSKKGLGRSAESHYPTMGIDEIRALPVAELAEKDCALFLWVTVPCLLEGLSVLQAWGFQYKTIAFVWIKQNKKADSLFWGMGYWTRSNAEFCILATRFTKTAVCRSPSGDCLPHRGTQQKATGSKGEDRAADGGCPPH